MGIYEYIIKDKNGNTIAMLDSARDRSYETYLNKSGSASFALSPKDPKITQDLLLVGNKELYIYRYGKVVWGGELVSRRTSVGEGRDGIVVTSRGFLELLEKKVIGSPIAPISYTNTDLSDIAWNSIDAAQTGVNASFGITEGNLATSRDADRTDIQGRTVKEIVEGVSNLRVANGIDFEMDANKQFSTFYPRKGSNKPDIVFEWGKNIDSFDETVDSISMANQIIVIGAGNGSETAMVTRDTAISGVQDTYKIRQRIIQAKSVSDENTLYEHADKDLSINQTQSQILGIKIKGNAEPALGSYVIGDSVVVRINYGITRVDALFRIYGIKVSISNDDEETIDLIFNPNI